MFFRRLKDDVVARLRRRMVHETEAALLYGLTFPDRAPRIPTVQVGCGTFQPAFAARWWGEVLDLDEETYRQLAEGPSNEAILPEFRRYAFSRLR